MWCELLTFLLVSLTNKMLRLYQKFQGGNIYRCFSTKLNLEQTLMIVSKETTSNPSDLITSFNQIINSFKVDPSQMSLIGSTVAREFFQKLNIRIPTFCVEETFKTLATCARMQTIPASIAVNLVQQIETHIPNMDINHLLQCFLLFSSCSSSIDFPYNTVSGRIITILLDDLNTPISSHALLAGLIGMSNIGYVNEDLLSLIGRAVATSENEKPANSPLGGLQPCHKVNLLVSLASLKVATSLSSILAGQLQGETHELKVDEISSLLYALGELDIPCSSLLFNVLRKVKTDATLWTSLEALNIAAQLARHDFLEIDDEARRLLGNRILEHSGSPSVQDFVLKSNNALLFRQTVASLRLAAASSLKTGGLLALAENETLQELETQALLIKSISRQENQTNATNMRKAVQLAAICTGVPFCFLPTSATENDKIDFDNIIGLYSVYGVFSPHAINPLPLSDTLLDSTIGKNTDIINIHEKTSTPINLSATSASRNLLSFLKTSIAFLSPFQFEGTNPTCIALAKLHLKKAANIEAVVMEKTNWGYDSCSEEESAFAAVLDTLANEELVYASEVEDNQNEE